MFPIEAFRNTLVKIVELFERHAIPFHLTGGITSVLYGEPRMTQDIDIVVENRAVAANLNGFLSSLKASDFMFEPDTVRQAVEQGGMFQLYDNVEALKLDIYPRELIAGELGRSIPFALFEDLSLPITCLADAALSKLVWISKGSHKSRRDLRRIYRYGDDADRSRIRQQARPMGLESLLEEVLNEPDEIS